MNYILLFAIRFYWILKSNKQPARCLFRISCSRYVYQIATEDGFFKGVHALFKRYRNCRHGYQLMINPLNGQKTMVLPDGTNIRQNEIAEKFLN